MRSVCAEGETCPAMVRSLGIVGLTLSWLARAACSGVDTPKYLVFPPPTDDTPTKVQLIIGLGIPMEVVASTIVGYVVKINYNLPYNATFLSDPYSERSRRSVDEEDPRRSEETGRGEHGLSRYEIYEMLESAIGTQTGRACVLRAICEAAAAPLNTDDSLFAQLLHVFLTPSSTHEKYRESSHQQYLAAESMGTRQPEACAYAFRDCGINILEYLSRIH